MSVEIVIGEGRSAFPASFPDHLEDIGGQLAGYRVTHPGPDGTPCGGENGHWIPTWPEGDGWTVVSEDPLHLEPSLLCRVCGDHGFIRGGAWVPA